MGDDDRPLCFISRWPVSPLTTNT